MGARPYCQSFEAPLWTVMCIHLLGLSWLLLAVALGLRGQSADWAFGVDFSVLPRPDAGDRAEGSSDPAGGTENGHCGRRASRWTTQGPRAVGESPVFRQSPCLPSPQT